MLFIDTNFYLFNSYQVIYLKVYMFATIYGFKSFRNVFPQTNGKLYSLC